MTDKRYEIPEKYKWDLGKIYPSIEEFDKDYNTAKELIAAFPRHESTMEKSAEGLYNALSDALKIDALVTKLYEYAFLNSDLDKSDNYYLALEGRVQNLANEAGVAEYFLSPKILKIPKKTTEKWFSEYPKLIEFRRIIELEQRYRPHTLSDECEKLMADLQNGLHTHSEIRGIFANADLTFGKIKNEDGKKIELCEATYIPLLMSEVRSVRRSAFRSLYKTYSSFGNTLASLMNAHVKEKTTLSKIRRFESSLSASTFSDEVTPDIYNNLIDTVSHNLTPLFDYYDMKKRVLGLSQLHMYDLYTPLIPSCTKEYSFEEAVEEVLSAVSILGEEYKNILEDGIKRRKWADVYPTKGKRGGAYSAGCYDTEPYILLNYTGKLDDVSTLAHEAGHSMHSYFSNKSNPRQTSQYTIFVAEVASTVNELLFCHKKLRESKSREERLSVLNQITETYKGTLYRQTMLAEFEKTIHSLVEDGETLTMELINEKYYSTVKKYFGSHVHIDREIACEWMRIPHFYRSFYVYKYATCISAASAIVKRIESGEEGYVDKYLKFLSAGGSMSPLDSLMVAEIDLTRPEVISAAISDFADAVSEFNKLYFEENAADKQRE